MTRRRFIQDPQTGKLHEVPVHVSGRPRIPAVHSDLEPFVSPVTGEVIHSRRQLREHNRRHDVAQHREYGDNEGADYFARRREETTAREQSRTQADRRDRIEALKYAIDKHTRQP